LNDNANYAKILIYTTTRNKKLSTLIQDDDMWVLERNDGQWVDYVWLEGVVTPIKRSGLFEPYSKEETSLILPTGVVSEDAIIIHTIYDLKVYNNIVDHLSIADLITLEDPEIVPTTLRYMVLDKEKWTANNSFSLIPSHKVYLAVRVEQQNG
jgi:hypothetical protein